METTDWRNCPASPGVRCFLHGRKLPDAIRGGTIDGYQCCKCGRRGTRDELVDVPPELHPAHHCGRHKPWWARELV